ncbi:GPI anchored serine-rich protein [Podospora conica]|nr:GPI anchored serine-rich protein [Schizothecium conicum]
MRFAAIIAGAGLAAASLEGGKPGSTLYSTEYTTVTSCAPEVTSCPAKSTVVKSRVVPLTTSTVYSTSVYTVTQCPDDVKDCPKNKGHAVTKTELVAVSTTICPVEATGTGAVIKPSTNGTWASWPAKSEGGNKPTGSWPIKSLTTEAPACPTFSVKTISTQITTVIPTVIYETVSIPCPTPAQPSAGFPTKPGNGTVVKPPPSTVTAGAATLGSSIVLAAAAGLAAIALL